MKLFQSNENSLYQWTTGKYVVDIFYKEKQGFFAIIKEDGHVVASILEREIGSLNTNKLKQLNVDDIKVVLDAHYPVVSQYSDGSYKLIFNVRGFGGWNKDVHKKQTKHWCWELGMCDRDGRVVAKACHGVDLGKTNTIKYPSDPRVQRWHFNINEFVDDKDVVHVGDGDPTDSRIQIAVKQFKKAANEVDREKALKKLGKGLHPLQDLFAHTMAFVSVWKAPRKCCNHILNMEADDRKHKNNDEDSPLSLDLDDRKLGFSQRYTSTKLITKFYVKQFIQKKGMDCNLLSSKVKEALAISHKQHEQNQDELMKRFLRFKQDLGLGNEPNLVAVNDELDDELDLDIINDQLAALMKC